MYLNSMIDNDKYKYVIHIHFEIGYVSCVETEINHLQIKGLRGKTISGFIFYLTPILDTLKINFCNWYQVD